MHNSPVPLSRGQQSKYAVSKSLEQMDTKKAFRQKMK